MYINISAFKEKNSIFLLDDKTFIQNHILFSSSNSNYDIIEFTTGISLIFGAKFC